jgi:hypothetical protein
LDTLLKQNQEKNDLTSPESIKTNGNNKLLLLHNLDEGVFFIPEAPRSIFR